MGEGRHARVASTRRLYRSIDIPQADRLANVRRLALAIRDGITHPTTTQEFLGVDPRHFNYYRQAGEILGIVEPGEGAGLMLTGLGRQLLSTSEGSSDERAVLRQAVASAPSL
ncbi:MAG: hypothetical protein KC431_16305, partial [Myxococcales bacterium]|nr:hypothetical protein [Myxococcales bacterium]